MPGPFRTLSPLLRDYGMIFALLLLCAFFSATTYTQQQPGAETAARQVAEEISRKFGRDAVVLIAVGPLPEDERFASQLSERLQQSGATSIEVVKGEPKDARQVLQRLAQGGRKLHAIATHAASADWLVFAELQTSFPSLGSPVVLKPASVRWPNFLKRDNLLNIANQIAVIAIIAVGMTIVIVAGGIDLSVGSIICLTACTTSYLTMVQGFGR